MKKIDIELVEKYLNGEDLGDYTDEELENNPEFMLQVINTSKDLKMYDFCSENLKTNYNFITQLVLSNKDNYEFIDDVASDCIIYNKDDKDDEAAEVLCQLMIKLLPEAYTEFYREFLYIPDDYELNDYEGALEYRMFRLQTIPSKIAEYLSFESSKYHFEFDFDILSYNAAKELGELEIMYLIEKEYKKEDERMGVDCHYYDDGEEIISIDSDNIIKKLERNPLDLNIYTSLEIPKDIPVREVIDNIKKIIVNQLYGNEFADLYEIVEMDYSKGRVFKKI